MLPLIAALATPVGHSAIAVVRLSGAGLDRVLTAICGRIPPVRRASLVQLRDERGVFDDAVLTVFSGPASYTGEDMAEVSCHGNPLIVERLLAALIGAGAAVASPGEFTRRALANGRIDLIGAEGVLATIGATSPAGLELARAGSALRGRAEGLRSQLVDVAAELEAILDYPGEDLLFSTDDQIARTLGAIAAEARGIAAGWQAGRVALDGARVALIGEVNAGKSSLFNALLGRERALVSPIPGTTRDVVESPLALPGGRIVLLDTAGERSNTAGSGSQSEPPTSQADAIEAAGMVMGRASRDAADLRILCLPATGDGLGEVAAPSLRVATQVDRARPAFAYDFAVSSVTGEGVEALRAALLPAITGLPTDSEAIVGSARQRDVLLQIADAAEHAANALIAAGPAVAVTDLAAAIGHAGAMSGRDATEDVLDRLFARFCVGK